MTIDTFLYWAIVVAGILAVGCAAWGLYREEPDHIHMGGWFGYFAVMFWVLK